MDEDNIEGDAIDLYQAADMKADIDPDHRDALDDRKRDQAEADPVGDPNTDIGPSTHPVADFLTPVTMSEMITPPED